MTLAAGAEVFFAKGFIFPTIELFLAGGVLAFADDAGFFVIIPEALLVRLPSNPVACWHFFALAFLNFGSLHFFFNSASAFFFFCAATKSVHFFSLAFLNFGSLQFFSSAELLPGIAAFALDNMLDEPPVFFVGCEEPPPVILLNQLLALAELMQKMLRNRMLNIFMMQFL